MNGQKEQKPLQMSEGEILRNYREAKDKAEQIKILAQLNLCSEERIKEILKEQGVDGRALPRKKYAQSAPALSTSTETEKEENEMKEPYIAPLAEVATASGHAEPTEPEEIPAGIPAEGKPVKAGKAPTTQTGHEAIIQLALQCLRRCTEDDMARAEAAYHDQMKQYNELLIRVDELMEEVRL